MKSTAVGTYLVGVLDYDKGDVDFESVAHAVNYLRGQNIKIAIGAAKVDGAHTRFPIIAEEKTSLASLVGDAAGGTAEALKTVFDSYGVMVRKAVPTASNLEQLKAITQVAFMDPRVEKVRACDLRPKACGGVDSDPFDGLIGLEVQKERLMEIGNTIATYGRQSLESLHLCFAGEPGVGKTEMARRLHRFFEAKGVVDGGPFVQASAQDLIAKYVGQTPELVYRAFERAEGGVLFIDEAYRLTEGTGNEFGIEAVNSIVQLLDERRESTICILAGYPDEMDRMLSLNPGLRERIGFRIGFPSYTVDELGAIFNRFAASKGFEVHPDAQQAVRSSCEKLKGLEGFANARSVRRLHDRAVVKMASRTDDRVIRAVDVVRALADEDMGAAPKRGPLGFMA